MTLNEIEQRLSALKSEQDKLTAELERLKAEQNEVKPWRAKEYEENYYYSFMGTVQGKLEQGEYEDEERYKIGNYYRTRELAEQDAKELALRGRIRQLRDALCEGYQLIPNNMNFCIMYSVKRAEYCVGFVELAMSIGEIYFDTREHAQTACDILNAEAHNGT